MSTLEELAAVYNQARPRLVRIAYAVMGSNSDAEDVVSDCWLSLAAANVRYRWQVTKGQDPLFAAVDGSNCPTLPQTQEKDAVIERTFALRLLDFAGIGVCKLFFQLVTRKFVNGTPQLLRILLHGINHAGQNQSKFDLVRRGCGRI